MNETVASIDSPVANCHAHQNAIWARLPIQNEYDLAAIEAKYQLDLSRLESESLYQNESGIFMKIEFINRNNHKNILSQVVLIASRGNLISLEPYPLPEPLNEAWQRIERDGRDNDLFDCLSVILQSICDSFDSVLDNINDDISESLVQSGCVLSNLKTKGKDFGASDVIEIQAKLGSIDEILSKSIENIMSLSIAANFAANRIQNSSRNTVLFQVLKNNIKGVGLTLSVTQDRIKFLQSINALALSVKQNQIIKIFTVMAAVFLPAMLVSTYYSMNFSNIPILEWKYAEPATLAFTVILAILPILYVSKRGWLN